MDLSKYRPSREFLLYKTPNGDVKVDVLLQNETIRMPQKKIAKLFDVNVPAISKHLNNIFKNGELQKQATVSILETVQSEGKFKRLSSRNYICNLMLWYNLPRNGSPNTTIY